MKKLVVVFLAVFLFSCSNEFKLTKENVESTYLEENRSLNLEGKSLPQFLNLNKFMKDTEVNNIFVGNNKIQVIDISSFEKLGKLEIDNNDIRFIGDLKLPENIRHLNLSHNNLDSLKGIKKYKNLKTLDISYNNLDDEDIDIVGLERLKYINIEGNNVSEEMLEKAANFNTRYLINNEVPYSN